MSFEEINRRIPNDNTYIRSSDRRRNCLLAGGHTFAYGRGYTGNGIEVYVYGCTTCPERTNVSKARHPEAASGPVFFDNRPGCCGGTGCVLCNTCPCERCGSYETVEQHHWAPSHLFGWQEANQWPTSWLCRTCHQRWHRTVTPNMGRRTA